jgi:hypothetical protein
MGQALTYDQKARLGLHENVLCVTQTHVVLKDGTVLDPADLSMGGTRVVLIRKLLQCNCGQHKAGLHIFVETTGGVNVFGTVFHDPVYDHQMPCRSGRWTTEEVITEEMARHFGILDQDTIKKKEPFNPDFQHARLMRKFEESLNRRGIHN